MDLDQTQAIYDFEEEEEEKVEQNKTHPEKKEAAHLKVFSQQGFKEAVFPVFQGDNFIGRDGKCNITIPIKALSKKHACIEVQRELHLIYDCGSKNKSKKGKSFLKPTIRYELKHGDMLTLGDVKCQYLLELDAEEDEEDETGSETGSESMLPEVTTEEEQDNDKPGIHEKVADMSDVESGIPKDKVLESVQDYKLTKPSKDEEEAYAGDTDSDTDGERPLAVAAMATVLYSSEDEQETPARQKATSVPSKENASMEGQTLAFGLGSPDNVFRNRESSGSAGSHPGPTGSLPPTLMLSSESDMQSDGKADLSSDNKQTSPKHPGARGSGTQPVCDPTLLYGSESDDGSPIKRPRHPEARVSDKQEPSCAPTLLYPSESEDGSPVKKPRHPRAPNEPMVLDESDSGKGSDKACEMSDVKRESQQPTSEEAVVKETDATLLYAAAELSSTDDEEESGRNTDDGEISITKPAAFEEPTLMYNVEESGKEEANEGEDNIATDEYGEDSATQPYAADSNFESEPIPFMGGNVPDKSGFPDKMPKPSELEATQAYCVEEEEEKEEEGEKEDKDGDSDSSDSQPLPIGPTAKTGQDNVTATLAYGLEATQAYNVTEKEDADTDSEDDEGRNVDNAKTLGYDLQATQAYGVGASDDDNDDEEEADERESRKETVEEQATKAAVSMIGRGDGAKQPNIAFGLESTQAYGADETDDEESDDHNHDTGGRDQGRAYGLAETLPYGGGDDDDDDDDDKEDEVGRMDKVAEPLGRQENQATLAYGLEETQAYDVDNNDTDSAPYPAIEATQAYGIEEPSEEELQAQAMQRKQRGKATKKRVAFASSFQESTEVTEVEETELDELSSGKDKAKPSTSTTANEEEDFQDSELIKPRSRSKRGRKKPVVEESQEERSQEASGRTSPNKGMSKVTEKYCGIQTEAASTSSSTDTTEQIEGADGTPEDEIPVTTPASRKGRRGAMRVTIEPSKAKEEEKAQETSTRRRGRKGTKMADDQEADNKKAASTPAGRKRGRQAAKAMAVTEPSEDVSMEVEETPAPKSRRGRRGKTAQTEAVSVLETPLNVASDEATVSEATDSQSATARVVETPSVRRGGRGKGRKGATAKEITQVVETQGQEEPAETEPETLKDAIPAKGKQKGRGKRNQSLATNEEVVPERTSLNEEELQPPESPAVSTASRGKGRGRQSQGKRTKPSIMELELSEDPSQTLSSAASGEGSQTRKGRGRGKNSRESSEQGPSSDLEVQETPAKKSRRGKEPSVIHSPSLRQGKHAGGSNPKVIFTGLVDKQGEKVVTSLGGELVDDVHSCTHLVTDKVRRTVKFLCGLAGGQIIVQPSWLDACKRAKSFVDTSPFLVKDKDVEKQYKFDLQRSHEVALRQGLLEGYKVHVTKKVKPEPSQMKDIIQSAKGEFLSSMPRGKEDRVFVISCKEDKSVCKKPLEAGIPVVSAEVLLTGVLRQQLDLEEHKIFAEEMSDTLQDTTSSSGQNKRRQQPTEADLSSSSTAETKRSGSKRRKR